MMTKFLLASFFITFLTYSQQKDYNLEEGIILEGYDVVSYFTNKALKGKKQYTTDYNDVTFRFSTKENLDTFLKSPNKFIPQYGGYCAYAIAAKKVKMDIDPEVFEVRDDKLYLFYNSWLTNKLEDWKEGDTKELQKQGDINWEVLQYVTE